MTELILALGAGLLSFLSPCVLPLIPGYISYVSGKSLNELLEEKKIITRPESILNSIELFNKIFPIRELVAPNAIKIKEKPTVKRIIGIILTFFSSSSSFKDFPDT